MAIQLIKQQTEKFNISKYKDTYNETLLKIIEDKYKGKKVKKPAKMHVMRTSAEDLMSRLKASLEEPRRKAG